MKLIYIHIPKTSGSAFRSVLLKNFSPSEYFICTGGNRTVRDYLQHSFDQFYSIRDLSNIRLFLGHMPYGLHRLIPTDCSYFTYVREPVDRVLSEYYYIVETPENQNHLQVNGLSISQYLTGDIFLPNLQSRMISGNLNQNATTGELIESAIYHLKNMYDFVGVYENLTDSIAKFEQQYHLKIGKIPTLNTTNNRPKVADIDKNILELILEKNAADVAVYKWCLSNLEQPITTKR